MAKKGLPVFVQLLIFLGAAAVMFVGGYFLMARTLPLAQVQVNGAGVTILNENVKDWPAGMVYINDPDLGIEASLPPLASGEQITLPYAAFHEYFKNRELKEIRIDKIWVSDMSGYQARSFDVEDIIIKTEIKPES